jgi:GNAT superfamily N-acetyltransferase
MSRSQVNVRKVGRELEPQLTRLWMESRIEAGASPDLASRAASGGRIASALSRKDVRAYLAFADAEPIGYMVLSHSPLPGLTDAPCISIDDLYTAQSARRHGAAHALLSAAAAYAERQGADQISSSVPAQGREANRFFARLGFTSYVVRRITTTASLRRKLAGDAPAQVITEVIQRRRSLRARSTAASRLLVNG